MGLEELVQELEKNAEKKVEETLSKAKAQAKAIMASAGKQAEKIRQDAEKEADKKIKETRRVEESQLEIRARLMRASAKEELALEAFARAKEAVRGSKNYPRLLEKDLSKAKKILGKTKVLPAKNDEEALKQIAAKTKDVEIGETLEKASGGFKAESSDKQLVVDATLDAKLEQAKQELRPMIYKILFGDTGGKRQQKGGEN